MYMIDMDCVDTVFEWNKNEWTRMVAIVFDELSFANMSFMDTM